MSFGQRASVCFALVFALLSLMAFRLVHVQAVAADGFRQHVSRKVLLAPRGEILDRNGTPLAHSEPGFDLWVEPVLLGDMRIAARAVAASVPRMNEEDVLARLISADGSVQLARGLSAEEAAAIGDARVAGATLRPSERRSYSLGAAATQLLGVVGVDGKGLEGIEMTWDSVLASRPGTRTVFADARRRQFDIGEGDVRPGMPGESIVLTIDAALQRIMYEEMDRAARAIRPASGAAAAIDPRNGHVLAMVSWPSYEPADRGIMDASAARNRPVADSYEPGSTFKSFVAAWAVDRGMVEPGMVVDCEGGRWQPLPGRTISDTRPMGRVPLESVLISSSNIGAAKIGRMLGADGLYECVTAFGFGRRTGVGLPGEASGILGPRAMWSPHTVISVPFGQELAVTPLQLATGYAALVNDGLLRKPSIIKGVVGFGGADAPEAEATRVIGEEASRWLRRALVRAVEDADGTARGARVEGLAVGGKTGTSQKFERDPETGEIRVSRTKYVASFVGFAPADEPRIVAALMWDEPEVSRSGGSAAAPVVAAFFRRAFFEAGVR